MFLFVCVCVASDKESKWKDAIEVKLEPLATISLIGLRGQQGSIDGSITLSIWWPSHIGLANRGLDAGHTRSPSLRLSYCAFQCYVTLTQKNPSDHLCWFTFGLHCPVNPLDQLKRTFLMHEDLCCKLLHSGKIWVHEMWHWNGVFVLDFFFKQDSQMKTGYFVWYFSLFLKTISLTFLKQHISILSLNIFSLLYQVQPLILKSQTYMLFEPKRGLDSKHKINASVFEACLLICSKVPGDLRIFIVAPLMIQQVQKYPSSDTTLPLTCQIQFHLSHQKEIPPHAAPKDMMSGVKRL